MYNGKSSIFGWIWKVFLGIQMSTEWVLAWIEWIQGEFHRNWKWSSTKSIWHIAKAFIEEMSTPFTFSLKNKTLLKTKRPFNTKQRSKNSTTNSQFFKPQIWKLFVIWIETMMLQWSLIGCDQHRSKPFGFKTPFMHTESQMLSISQIYISVCVYYLIQWSTQRDR